MSRGRKRNVRFYESRGGYYTTYQGKTYCLANGPDDQPAGPTFAEACKRFGEITCTDGMDRKGSENTCLAILESFIAHANATRKPTTVANYTYWCQAFANVHGARLVGQLRPWHVTDWLTRHSWSDGTKHLAVTVLVRAFNWARKQGLIDVNPIAGMERPQANSRGEEVVIDDQEHEAILKAASRWFAPFLVALWDSGARPGEIAKLQAKDWNEGMQAFVLGDWKKAEGGRKRVINFTDEVLARIIRPLMQARPTGPLFLTRRGRAWHHRLWSENMRRLRRKLGLREDLIAYSYRHRLCTALLKGKMPLACIVEAMGHKDAKMIFHHYGHLAKDNASIRAELNRVAASSAAASKTVALPGFLM
jgi:integrase